MKILRNRRVKWGGGMLILALFVLFALDAVAAHIARPARVYVYAQLHDALLEEPDVRLDINSATWAELAQLDGIGRVLAERIIDYRSAHGAFADIEQIMDVYGIGEVKFEAIRDRIKVENS